MSKVRKPQVKIQENPEKADWTDRNAAMCYVRDWISSWRARLEKMDAIAHEMCAECENNPDGTFAAQLPLEQLHDLAAGLDQCCTALTNIIPPVDDYITNPVELMRQSRAAREKCK